MFLDDDGGHDGPFSFQRRGQGWARGLPRPSPFSRGSGPFLFLSRACLTVEKADEGVRFGPRKLLPCYEYP